MFEDVTDAWGGCKCLRASGCLRSLQMYKGVIDVSGSYGCMEVLQMLVGITDL